MEELLAYDVTGNSPLFGDDGFIQKSTKSELVHELEKHLSPEDYAGPLSFGQMATTYLVDVMVHMRKTSLKDKSTFGELIERTLDTTNVISPQANWTDYVFDSPKDGSIKDSERMRRTDAEKPHIGLWEVKMHTPITKNMEYFWPLNENKTNLQVLMYDTIKQHASENENYMDIVLGSIQDNRMATKVIDNANAMCLSSTHLMKRLTLALSCTLQRQLRLVPND